jgi:hypothetical protein
MMMGLGITGQGARGSSNDDGLGFREGKGSGGSSNDDRMGIRGGEGGVVAMMMGWESGEEGEQ